MHKNLFFGNFRGVFFFFHFCLEARFGGDDRGISFNDDEIVIAGDVDKISFQQVYGRIHFTRRGNEYGVDLYDNNIDYYHMFIDYYLFLIFLNDRGLGSDKFKRTFSLFL